MLGIARWVRTVMPIGPKISFRFGDCSQCSTSSTSWNMTWVAMPHFFLTAVAVLDDVYPGADPRKGLRFSPLQKLGEALVGAPVS